MNFPLIMIYAIRWCFILQETMNIIFSKALWFRMCTATKYCSDFVNSVSIALQSYVTAHRILSSLPSIQRQSNGTNCFVVFWYFCHFCSCALMVFCFERSRNYFLWKEGITLRYVPYICLSEKRKITANLPLWIMKKIKNK